MLKAIKLLVLCVFFLKLNLISMEINEFSSLINNTADPRPDFIIDITSQEKMQRDLKDIFQENILEEILKHFDGTEDVFLYYLLPLTGFLTEKQAQKIAQNIYFNITKKCKTAAGWQHILQKVRKTLLLSQKNKLDEDGQKRLRNARKLIFKSFDEQEEKFKILEDIRYFNGLDLAHSVNFCCFFKDLAYDSHKDFISKKNSEFPYGKNLKNLSNLELKHLFIKTKLCKLLCLQAQETGGVSSSRKSCNPIKSSFLCSQLSSLVCIVMALGVFGIGIFSPSLVFYSLGYFMLFYSIQVVLFGIGSIWGRPFISGLCCSFPSSEIFKECFDNERLVIKEFLRRKRELLENKFEEVGDEQDYSGKQEA